MIIMRTFFENTIPNELIEAAALDGCNDITTFFRIVLPLSGAVFAVMALFYGVAQWNSWFPALLYIRDRSLYPLQMILREVLIQSDIGNMAGSTGDVEVIGDGLKYATMVVSTLPIMCLYPFLQKYFVAGVTIGAVKLMEDITPCNHMTFPCLRGPLHQTIQRHFPCSCGQRRRSV